MCRIMVNSSVKQVPIWGFFLLCIVQSHGFAMPEDQQQIARVSAHSADLNQSSHRGTYVGDVQFDQGTTHVRAAKAITEVNQQNRLVTAIIHGDKHTQAHYWTQTASDKPLLHAYADSIYYFPERHLIQLIGHARIEQGNNSFSAPEIGYDTLHQHITSKSDKTGRTVIMFHSETHL